MQLQTQQQGTAASDTHTPGTHIYDSLDIHKQHIEIICTIHVMDGVCNVSVVIQSYVMYVGNANVIVTN